jgi:hypothetical protein
MTRPWRSRWLRASASMPSAPARPCRRPACHAGGAFKALAAELPLGYAADADGSPTAVAILGLPNDRPDDRPRWRRAPRMAGTRGPTPRKAQMTDDRAHQGAEVIRNFVKTLPTSPGVYRMFDEAGEVDLCRQGAQPQGARHQLHAPRRPRHPHPRMIAATRNDGVRPHRDRGRGPAARGQPHQAAETALQRAAARRQELPLHPHRHRARSARADEASRRARTGRATISAPSPRRSRSSAPSTSLQKAFLLRTCSDSFYKAAPGPACCTRSSAARRPAPARYRSTTMPSWSRRRGSSCPASRNPCRTTSRRHERRRRALDFERAAAARPALGPRPRPEPGRCRGA